MGGDRKLTTTQGPCSLACLVRQSLLALPLEIRVLLSLRSAEFLFHEGLHIPSVAQILEA